MKNLTIGFIGLGLIGGSIAKGLKRIYPQFTIMAYTRSPQTLEAALADHSIDLALTDIDEHFLACDYIFLCTPVTLNESYLSKIKPYMKPGCILTDVGSVKTNIHEGISRLSMDASFIGGHPMAGSEKSGYAYSNDRLIENAYYVLTPTPQSPAEKVEELSSLIKALGAIVLVLDCRRHDSIVAAISHLPHLIASSLVNLVRDKDGDDHLMKQVAAGGFKDITRIASSSPEMWQQICVENQTNITDILGDYIESLTDIRRAVASGDQDAVYRLFSDSREYRNSIPDRSAGPIKKQFAIYCDIIDESGALATVATILAANQISIKNIGIIHNREFEEGVLKIEFYDEDAAERAEKHLSMCHYTVTKR